MKPSIDQVLTNSPGRLCRSADLGVALGDVDRLDAQVAHQPAPAVPLARHLARAAGVGGDVKQPPP